MLENGALIAGRYEIIEKIGTGGMSDVYKALDTSLSREVALKVLKDDFVTDMEFVSKFRQEAKAAAGLEHPNIVNIYDVGNQDGHYFIVMEYVEGITLKTYIAKKGCLNYSELLSIAIQVGRGIEAAHNKNIIHRDIKPQNIIISKEGKVKVTDFGIARAVTSNTINADRMGSVHYSSPEQARNGFVTYQSDIYSLGIMMYEMATGRVPFDGDSTVAVAILHLQSEMVPPSQVVPDVPISVEKIILRATMKNPERRYRDISEMLTDLKKAMVSPGEDFVIIPPPTQGDESVVEVTPVAPVRTEVHRDIPNKPPVTPAPPRRPAPDPMGDDDYDDDEDSPKSGLDKAITIMGIAAAVVIVLIVVYLVLSFMGVINFGGGGSKDAETTTSSSVSSQEGEVPRVIGMTESEARKTIEDAGFKYKKIGDSSSEEYKEGEIMEQSVDGGKSAPLGSTISVMVSNGKGDTDVPSVVGMTQQDAISKIEDAKFVCISQQEYNDSVEQGRVIRQSPAGNAKAKKGDSITIYVSRGSEVKPIPNVVGKSQSAATSELTSAGFTVTTEFESDDSVDKGSVISQSPSGQAAVGSAVHLIISNGSAQSYYRGSITVSPVDGESTYIVIRDANGDIIDQRTITETVTINASNIKTSTGSVAYYSGSDMSEELRSRESVTFTQQ